MPFPLPVTPFEYYYLSDDRPQYPMTFPIDLQFSGSFHRELLAAALARALERHPLLRAYIDDSKVRPSWIPCSSANVWFDWADAAVPITHPAGEPIDLRNEPGLRVWVRTDGSSTRILMQFHHACCDGIGATEFVEDWLICYAHALTGMEAAPHLVTLDAQQLHRRGEFIESGNAPPSMNIAVRNGWITICEWASILLRKPAILAAPPQVAARTVTGPRSVLPLVLSTLTADETLALKEAALAQQATLNELMLRDLFLAIGDWHEGLRTPMRRRMWLNVPVNLRRRIDRAMPAANRIAFAFVSLSPRQCRDRSGALSSIHDQMERIRQRKLGLYFLGGLAFACGFKGVVPWVLRRERSFATMVLSNMGRVFAHTGLPRHEERLVCGDAVLERVAAAPPVRPLTRGAIAITEYAGALTVCLRNDAEYFQPDDSQLLLEKFLYRLRQSAQLGG